MKVALLSIIPKYVEKIFSGKKRYEFRKSIFKDTSVLKIYIYSTSPVKRIVGAFRIGRIIEDHPKLLWEQFYKFSGATYPEFFAYFADVEKGFAIEIKEVEKFDNPIDPKKFIPNFVPPQSFYYVDYNLFPTKGVKEGILPSPNNFPLSLYKFAIGKGD